MDMLNKHKILFNVGWKSNTKNIKNEWEEKRQISKEFTLNTHKNWG